MTEREPRTPSIFYDLDDSVWRERHGGGWGSSGDHVTAIIADEYIQSLYETLSASERRVGELEEQQAARCVCADVPEEDCPKHGLIPVLKEKLAASKRRVGELEDIQAAADEIIGVCDCIIDETGKVKQHYYALRYPTPPEPEEADDD